MSLSIWTRCEGPSRVRPLELRAWRVVESQHRVSTRRLVDSLEEQQLLEEIVDEVKPPRPQDDPRFEGLNFLLWTPFRHPPLRRGSRFGRRDQRSLWYGAEQVETSLAEKAYYQLVFLEGSTADLSGLACDWTSFSVRVQTARAVDLTAAPFVTFRAQISSPVSYAVSQPLGAEMRAAGVELVRFHSARCPRGGSNVGLFRPAFASNLPRQQQNWRCQVGDGICEVFALNSAVPRVLSFPRALFEVEGRLPFPAG